MRFPQYLSISCGSCHIVSVHLEMSPSGRCDLLDYNIEPVGFATSEPLLWLKAASQRLAGIRKRFKGDMPTGFSYPGHLVLTKYLKIPQGPAKKRDRIVAYEARQNIPYPISEVTWDHSVIDEDEMDFETVIAAAKSEQVEALARYGRESKMDPEQIQPAFVSLLNGFRFNYPDAEGCSLIVSVGAKSTDLIYIEGKRYYSRNVSIGGHTVTQEISDALGMPFDDAEHLKLAAIEGEQLSDLEANAFAAAATNFRNRVAVEINRTTAIFRRQGFERRPQLCLLAGGGSLLGGLAETLQERLSVRVERFDALKRIGNRAPGREEALSSDSPFLCEAIGMALGRFLPDAHAVNLIPRALVWQKRFRRQQPFYLAASLVLCAAAALPIVNLSVQIAAYEQENANLELQIAPLRELNEKIRQRTRSIDELKSIIDVSIEVANTRANWIKLLNDMQERLLSVEDVWLDRLQVIRPEEEAGRGNRFSRNARNSGRQEGDSFVKLRLEGRLIDVKNPMSTVSPDSYNRVKALLDSFERSSFIAALENERFDNAVPGILKFDFVLVVDPSRSL